MFSKTSGSSSESELLISETRSWRSLMSMSESEDSRTGIGSGTPGMNELAGTV